MNDEAYVADIEKTMSESFHIKFIRRVQEKA